MIYSALSIFTCVRELALSDVESPKVGRPSDVLPGDFLSPPLLHELWISELEAKAKAKNYAIEEFIFALVATDVFQSKK